MYNTEKEIRDELNSISKCLQLVCGKEDEILRTFSGARRMWFIGSGSSFCLAKSAAAMFTMRCDIPSLAVAAGGSAAAYRAVSECRKGQRSGVCIPLRHDQRGAAGL